VHHLRNTFYPVHALLAPLNGAHAAAAHRTPAAAAAHLRRTLAGSCACNEPE
jgi:hypothetical protein